MMMTTEVEMEVESQRPTYMAAAAAPPPVQDQSYRDNNHTNSNNSIIFQKCQRPVTLQFEYVMYKIKIKKKDNIDRNNLNPKSRYSERTILNNVSGVVMPGEMLAMMGPSGSGKTTLLTALGARLGGNLTGTITYNNKPFSAASIQRNMGFVTQDDVLYPHLTVTETLFYTALLRLPPTLTRHEKAAQAEAVMAQLGLTPCRDSVIGGPLVRGVSGGERKRVSIGQEMLINPSLMFLDEPTSGLDATTAQRIVSVLWELARGRGRTVVMTIHQPSSRLFYMFDKILLMADGNPVYFGKGSEAMDYFASIGYVPSLAMNPSDFLLDLSNGVPPDESQHLNRAAVKQSLLSSYTSNIQPMLNAELNEVRNKRSSHDNGKEMSRWSTSWWQQFQVLLQRDLKERRHEAFSAIKIIQIMLTALLAGLLWWHSNGHVQDQLGLLFFITGFWAFSPIYEAIFTFPQERSMLEKERSSGMYRLSSYFMARTVSDLPIELILPILSITTMYWLGGLRPTATSFFETLSVLLLGVLVAQGLGLAIGALCMNLKTAATLGNVIMLTFMLAGGFFVQKVPVFVRWTKYVSLIYYTFKLTMISQFSGHGGYRCPEKGTCYVEDLPSVKAVGLDNAGISILVLSVMLVVYRLVAYLALTRIGATKK